MHVEGLFSYTSVFCCEAVVQCLEASLRTHHTQAHRSTLRCSAVNSTSTLCATLLQIQVFV